MQLVLKWRPPAAPGRTVAVFTYGDQFPFLSAIFAQHSHIFEISIFQGELTTIGLASTNMSSEQRYDLPYEQLGEDGLDLDDFTGTSETGLLSNELQNNNVARFQVARSTSLGANTFDCGQFEQGFDMVDPSQFEEFTAAQPPMSITDDFAFIPSTPFLGYGLMDFTAGGYDHQSSGFQAFFNTSGQPDFGFGGFQTSAPSTSLTACTEDVAEGRMPGPLCGPINVRFFFLHHANEAHSV